ncbi:MAG TPA: hypothetical protein VFN94_03170 [Nitrospiria bacterium]|nr:hypothetical protein [Nitrospiria bacterium]
MRALGSALYAALRGGGAVIEGAEFLIAAARLSPRRIGHLLAAAACVLIATKLFSGIATRLPTVPEISFPWYLVLVEWGWSNLSSGLAAAATAWGAETLYLGWVSVRDVVDTVVSRRGGMAGRRAVVSARRAAIACLVVGGFGCVGVAYVPIVGPLAALAAACPVLGAGFAAACLAQRGWPPDEITRLVRRRVVLLGGLGGGVLVLLTIPLVNLVVLPCAAAGTVCLLLREERADSVKTSAGTTPCVSPSK